ncbi:MAG: Rpn family recombination-promoting nuclease/putative transposase [Holosporales bacterium]|jgi:predicted transposase/invertase (TIGR01784 family)|nr:Rpn family recombination-promoting nuclease/putative transposase [Holosporales bacterium]
MERFLNPRNDWMFKKIFGSEPNKDILIDLLNAVFDGTRQPIEDVVFLPTHQDPEIAALRQTIVDVRCTDTDKNQFIVEMQHYGDPFFIKRACLYASRAYSIQLRRRDPNNKTKENLDVVYGDVKPVIFLAILDTLSLIKGEDCISHNALLDIVTHANNIKEFSFSFIRLDKFNKTLDESESLVDKWCYFFKNAETTEQEDFEKIKKHWPLIGKAYDVLEVSNYTPEEYDKYCRHQMYADAHESCIWGARQEGLAEGEAKGLAAGKAEGLAEGEAKKALETATLMLAGGLQADVISQYTGLSIEEVQTLSKA